MVADATATSLPAAAMDAVMCIDALQLVPDRSGLLHEAARILRPGGRLVFTTWERRDGAPGDVPFPYAITDVRTLAGAAGLRVLVREEHDDWQEQEQELMLYRRAIAEDSDGAEPALRLMAAEGREILPHAASARRLLLVATV